MRKNVLCLSVAGALVAGIPMVRAAENVMAEAIPADFIQQFAPFAVLLIQQQFPEPPVKVDLSAEKAQGFHVKEMLGIVLMPDKNLNAETVSKAGEKDSPVGVVATRSLTVEGKDAPVAADKLAVADFNGMIKIPVFFLSVKGKGEDRTLEVYSKEGTAVASAPLKKGAAADGDKPLAVKLTNIDLEKKKLDAVFSVSGGYEGTVKFSHLDLK